MDVVLCLSTQVRNDTLQDAKEQKVSVKCRKQLRVEELEMVSQDLQPVSLSWWALSLSPGGRSGHSPCLSLLVGGYPVGTRTVRVV